MTRSDSENRNPSSSKHSNKRARSGEEETAEAGPSKRPTKKGDEKRDKKGDEKRDKKHKEKRDKKSDEKRDKKGDEKRKEKRGKKSDKSKNSPHQQDDDDVDKEKTEPSGSLDAVPHVPSPPNSLPNLRADASRSVSPSVASKAQPGTPSSQIGGLPPTVQVSPRSRVHGKSLCLGESSWLSLATRNAQIVDKSLAIKRVISSGDKVKVGLAPRRSGKSTFLRMLAAFLSTESAVSVERRMELFSNYDIYTKEEDFFNAHFAKYAVLYLSFKSDTPKSDTAAAACLRGAILEAVRPHIRPLCRRLSALEKDEEEGKGGTYESYVLKSTLKRVKQVHSVLEEGRHYEEDDITSLIPLVAKALSLSPGMQKPVVLIDEYDTPLVYALCDPIVDSDSRLKIHQLYTSFYSAIFKDNDYLEFGIMAGVFNVPLKAGGSGLNNVEAFLAHTGAPRPLLDEHDSSQPAPRPIASTGINPFDTAFSLTVNDVWGLVNSHIDQYAHKALPETTTSELTELKREMMAHCIRSYDGYMYGEQPVVFNTYCVLKFFKTLGEHIHVPMVRPSAHYYWSQTGTMTMIRSLSADNADIFRAYVDRLSREYVQRHSFLYGGKSATGVLAAKLAELNIDGQTSSLAQYEDEPLPFKPDCSLIDLADNCYDEGRSSLADWGSSDLSVDVVFRYLYQAGYLMPRENGALGIPNEDVFHAFQTEAESIFSASGIAGTILDPTFRAIGIGTGDFVLLANYISSSLVTSVRVSEASLREDYYHGLLQALLAPLRFYGFGQRVQSLSEGGFSDLELVPPRNGGHLPGATQVEKSARPYVIYELKRLDDKSKMTHAAAMTKANRKKVLAKAEKLCKDAMAQIDERYERSVYAHANGSSALYFVGLTFWRQRFLMHVSRHIPGSNGADISIWTKQAYEESEFKNMNTNSVRISIKGGNLIANNI
ncbi:hypothetical protein GGI13_004059 [Coemansia sp. RSA 455]|nr:hypothetical protein GGI13_004059 [Coemansia sp. RSA 455]